MTRTFPSNLDYGFGYDDLTGVQKATAVNYDGLYVTVNGIPEVAKQGWLQKVATKIVLATLKSVETSEEMSEALGLEAEASYSGATFNVSLSAQYTNNFKKNKNETNVVASVISETDSYPSIKNPRLSKEARKYLEDNGWELFREKYGCKFVSGFKFGGHYFGMLNIKSKSVDEKEEWEAALTANVSTAIVSADLEAEIKKVNEKYGAKRSIDVKVIQSGGDAIIETDYRSMISQFRTFVEDLKNNSVKTEVVLVDYNTLDNLPPDYAKLPGYISYDVKMSNLRELNKKYLDHKDLKSDIEYVRNNLREFDSYNKKSDKERQEYKQELSDDLKGVNNKITELIECERKIRGLLEAETEPGQQKALCDVEDYVMTAILPNLKENGLLSNDKTILDNKNAGELEFKGWNADWGKGWNIQTKNNGTDLCLNPDGGEDSNVLIGRWGKQLAVNGKNGDVEIAGDLKLKKDGNEFRMYIEGDDLFFEIKNSSWKGKNRKIKWDGDGNWDDISHLK